MADISGIIQAANMGIQNNARKKEGLQQAGQYAGESIYRKRKDAQDRADEIRKEKIQSDQFNRTLSETEGFHNMSLLLDMYGEVMANERAAMAGPIDKGENTDLWSKFQEGMGFVSGINEDWYTPENLASYKQVYFDPEMRDKATQDFEEWLKSVPNQNDRTVLRAWFDRALREGQALPEPKPEIPREPGIPAGVNTATPAEPVTSAVSGLGTAGSGLPSGAREEYQSAVEQYYADLQGRVEAAPQGYQNPAIANLNTDFVQPRLRTDADRQEWVSMKNNVEALLRSIPRTVSPEDQQKIQAQISKITGDTLFSNPEVTPRELQQTMEMLNQILRKGAR